MTFYIAFFSGFITTGAITFYVARRDLDVFNKQMKEIHDKEIKEQRDIKIKEMDKLIKKFHIRDKQT